MRNEFATYIIAGSEAMAIAVVPFEGVRVA